MYSIISITSAVSSVFMTKGYILHVQCIYSLENYTVWSQNACESFIMKIASIKQYLVMLNPITITWK